MQRPTRTTEPIEARATARDGELVIAAHSVDFDGTVPEWVHVLPLGTFSGRDGRGPYTVEDPQAVIDASLAEGAIPFDYDHGIFKGTDGRASAWVSEMEIRADGIYARPKFTPHAEQAIRDKEYRGASPVIVHQGGRVLRIDHVGLVNKPNLHLRPLTAAPHGEQHMKTLAQRLAAIFGLDDNAGDDTVAAHAQQLVEQRAELVKAVGLEQTAAHSAVLDAVKAAPATEPQAAEPDPAKYVPMSAFNELSAKLARLQGDVSASKAEAMVAQAKKDRKVSPGMNDWARDYAEKDPQGFIAWAKNAPVVVSEQSAAGAPPVGGVTVLTEAQARVADIFGIDHETFAKELAQDNHDTPAGQ